MHLFVGISFLITLTSTSDVFVPSDSTVFSCNFRDETCGIVNQVGMRGKWIRKELDAGGQKGTVMVVDTTGQKKQLARMITPYFELYRETDGCLTVHFFMSGEGVSFFRVEEQTDTGFQKLISIHTQVSHWRTLNVPVRVTGSIRFLFEAQVNPSFGKTVVAVDNVVFKLGSCLNALM